VLCVAYNQGNTSARGGGVRDIDTILDQLKSTGLRITRPRREVVREIKSHSGVFSGDGLYEQLQRRGSGVGRATVFRTIDVLVELQILERVHQPDGSHGYVLRSPGHRHHLVCSDCGVVVEFQGCNLNELMDDLAGRTNFSIKGHWLEVFGTCEDCQQAAS
jgi:Fur family transcriptional regulator, ferric uptake regulator